MKKLHPSLALICAFFWGLSYPLVKLNQTAFVVVGIGSLMLVAGLRFVISGGIIVLWNLLRHRRNPAIPACPSWSSIPHILILALSLTAVHYLFMYMGLGICTGSKSSILKQTSVLLVIFFSGVFFPNDKLTVKKVIGCLLGFSSVIVCGLPLSDFDFVPAGDIPILLASLSTAVGDLYTKRISCKWDPIFLSGWQQFIGGIILISGGLIGGGTITQITHYAVAVLLVVCGSSIIAYTLYMVLTKYCELSKISLYKLTIPVFSVLTSGILLHENIVKLQYWAAILLVSSGVLISNHHLHKQHTKKEN